MKCALKWNQFQLTTLNVRFWAWDFLASWAATLNSSVRSAWLADVSIEIPRNAAIAESTSLLNSFRSCKKANEKNRTYKKASQNFITRCSQWLGKMELAKFEKQAISKIGKKENIYLMHNCWTRYCIVLNDAKLKSN